MEQLKMDLGTLVVDGGAYSLEQGRKRRPSRHAIRQGKLACGHKGLPVDGDYVQYPLSFAALLQVVDCPTCHNYLMAQAALKVVGTRSTPVCNTGVNYPPLEEQAHDNG